MPPSRLLQILEACCGAAGCTPYKQWQTLANTTTLCMYPGNLCRCLRASATADALVLCPFSHTKGPVSKNRWIAVQP